MSETATQLFRMVAGVDASDAAHAVIERAIDAAKRFDCDELHFLRVVPKRGNGDLERAHDSLAALVSEKLADFAPAEAGNGTKKLRARVHVSRGNPAEEILELAADVQAQLIVIGRHGESGRLRDRFGTVPSRVIRDATCTVLVEQPSEYVAQAEDTCEACAQVRRDTDGEQWFCDVHADGHEWKSSTVIASAFTPLHGVY